eukprot:1778704-Rhodomonas_salina.11
MSGTDIAYGPTSSIVAAVAGAVCSVLTQRMVLPGEQFGIEWLERDHDAHLPGTESAIALSTRYAMSRY